jgi:putative isomerase
MRRLLMVFLSACSCLAPSVCLAQAKPAATPRLNSPEYAQLQQRLSRGWNTWDVHSVTTQVLLPEALSVRVGVQKKTRIGGDGFLSTALIGRLEADSEQVFPGPHAFDGSYTDLRLAWQGLSMRIQSATDAGDLVLLVTPLPGNGDAAAKALPATVVFSVGFLWDMPGAVERTADHIEARAGSKTISFFVEGRQAMALNAPVAGPYLAVDLRGPRTFSSGKRRTVVEVQAILDRQRAAYEQSNAKAGESASIADAIQTVLAWDTIYDPENRRVISPVSRVWSVGWGGYVLFDWDTFFAASMASIGNRDLAYADAIETLNEVTAEGFVPNFGRGGGWKSDDRSEPPVGAITVLGLYEKFKDKWLLRDSFDRLLAWNRWWAAHRDVDGYLVWGSDTHDSPECHDDASCGTLQGARYESGLDNSPMYDDAPFDKKTERMMLADVGLMGMYVADCDALSTIAGELGKAAEAKELSERAQRYREKVATLWDENTGIFLNKDLISGKLSPRLSPTNFYPMMAKAATAKQADRMVKEHLLNPSEFGGEFVLPSIARNDAAYKDQDYWRGRVWGPMNYLVYQGLRNYNQPEARQELASKSLKLFLKEWNQNGHVHENYNATLGNGDDVKTSDRFYHWGALLGYITYLEQADPVAAKP